MAEEATTMNDRRDTYTLGDPRRYRKITPKEMRKIASDYLSVLPGWRLVRNEILTRVSGPVLQGICLERKSALDYEPRSFINVLASPASLGLELLMDVNRPNGIHWRVRLWEHVELWRGVADAIIAQVRPSVLEPLTPNGVLHHYEYEVERSGMVVDYEFMSLASLSAYLGDHVRSRRWIAAARTDQIENPGAWRYDYSPPRIQFLNDLSRWLDEGSEREHLEECVTEARHLWKWIE